MMHSGDGVHYVDARGSSPIENGDPVVRLFQRPAVREAARSVSARCGVQGLSHSLHIGRPSDS
jgi:hypothetical protein